MVSIIIPTFNSEVLLPETLQSVLIQSYQEWECLVIDDGSEDDTIDIGRKFQEKDSRFSVISRPYKKPKGANACRNYGIEISTGDYIIFLDADDLLRPTCLETRVAQLKQYPSYDGIVSSLQVISYTGEKKKLLNVDPEDLSNMSSYAAMFLSYTIPWQTTAPTWRRAVFKKYGVFNESFQRFQDVEFHTRFLLEGCELKRIDAIDVYYRQPDTTNLKYQNPIFVNNAVIAIYNYVETYVDFSNTSVLGDRERKRCLKKMLLKTYGKFISKKENNLSLSSFLNLCKRTEILSFTERFQLRLYHLINTRNWHTVKGLGIFKLRKNLQKKLEL